VEYEHAKQFAELYEWEVKVRIATLEEPHYADIFTSEMQSILTASLEKLPKQTQYIFVQNRFKHRPRKEIAAEMKVSIQKIDYHINKATDHLYKDLKDYLPLLVYFFSKICN
jgi:RNA polymerase sigma-70 factor (ECF subfamily)